jgi:hypothetical protein
LPFEDELFFLFLPNIRPNTDLKEDFFRSGLPASETEPAAEFRKVLGITTRLGPTDWSVENVVVCVVVVGANSLGSISGG